jgi:DNA-binding NarL/FixJ family response regulator
MTIPALAVVTAGANRARFSTPTGRGECPVDLLSVLSDRERQVLASMAAGKSNHGISQQLYLSEKTVETHISSIFSKLGIAADGTVNRRVHAVLHWLSTSTQPHGAL